MNGTDMLINAVLKAVGYKKEDMDRVIAKGAELHDYIGQSLKNFDTRLSNIERHQAQILANQERMFAVLEGRADHGRVIEGDTPKLTIVEGANHA